MTVANGQTLSTYTFKHIIKSLNIHLNIYSSSDPARLAGLYFCGDNIQEHICGVDKQYVPAYASFDSGGHVIKSGWRRVIWILLGNGFTDRGTIRKVIPGFFDSRACAADRFVGGIAGDPIENKILRYSMSAPVQRWRDPDTKEIVEGSCLTDEQNLEIANDIRNKDSDAKKQEREEEKWFLETWKKRGGNPSDKPQA